MYDPLTYRHPRTMQEAFGPNTDHTLHPMEEEKTPMSTQDKIIMAVSGIAAVICAIVIAFGGKW